MNVSPQDFIPKGYVHAMTSEIIAENWPVLTAKNFKFKSRRTPRYNCLAWAINDNSTPIEMFYFQIKHKLDENNLDHTVNGYAIVLEKFYGYKRCNDGIYEEGFEKIILYGDNNNEWTHAARQLNNGMWVSKMGTWEDIQHSKVEVLNGPLYGQPKIYMKRNII